MVQDYDSGFLSGFKIAVAGWYVIDAAVVPWVAAPQPFNGEPRTFEYSVHGDRL